MYFANRMPKIEKHSIWSIFPADFFAIVQILFTLIGSMIRVHVLTFFVKLTIFWKIHKVMKFMRSLIPIFTRISFSLYKVFEVALYWTKSDRLLLMDNFQLQAFINYTNEVMVDFLLTYTQFHNIVAWNSVR